ncbi:MAG: hypothetical protein ACRDTZ_01165 [Pseudonocardiaceae bacterium]
MNTTPPPLPPDDDPRFAKWINDVGPMQEMPNLPDAEPGKPTAAAIALLVGLTVIVAVLGWAAFALATRVGVYHAGATVLLTIGTLLVIIGTGLAYAGRRRR